MVKYVVLSISLFIFGSILCGEKSSNVRILKDGTMVDLHEFANTIVQLNRLSPIEQEALLGKCMNNKMTDPLSSEEQKKCAIFMDGQR